MVETMVPARGVKPNIFIFVIDALQLNYLGAYNPRANFTPRLDAFARDSVVWKSAFTQYAGTSLSEPTIWAGALLLHAHYMTPFSRENNLEKLAKMDGYQMVVSYDAVLKQVLSPSDGAIKLDTDKERWNNFEISSTLDQLKSVLDRRTGTDAPVLFYAQPMNVHGAADNPLPKWSRETWKCSNEFRALTSFQLNQVDTSLGSFFDYLKDRGLYDESIIVITADHGDGPRGHSTYLDPAVMRVPLLVHLPKSMHSEYVYDEGHVATPTDITPTLYYLLGHRPLNVHPLLGRPLFAQTQSELQGRQYSELFLASDSRAGYGVLKDGRYMYTTYDSPAQSSLYDLQSDPDGHYDLLTESEKKHFDETILSYLRLISVSYGNTPTGGRNAMDDNWESRINGTSGRLQH
jgi:arylsulfatase A-like enzyme